jgi:hypothetical protein
LDEVDVFDRITVAAALRIAVAESGNEREVLKMENMSKASPRVFWSVILALGADWEAAMRSVFPSWTDWRFLTTRKRELSEKARANLEQFEAGAASSVMGEGAGKVNNKASVEVELHTLPEPSLASDELNRLRNLLRSVVYADALLLGQIRVGPLSSGLELGRLSDLDVNGPGELDDLVFAAQTLIIRSFCAAYYSLFYRHFMLRVSL